MQLHTSRSLARFGIGKCKVSSGTRPKDNMYAKSPNGGPRHLARADENLYHSQAAVRAAPTRPPMSVFRKFLRLETEERRLHLRAVTLMAWISVVVHFRGLPAMQEDRSARTIVRPRRQAIRPHIIALAVTRAGRYVPGASCLVRAIVTCRLLNREGYDSVIRVGVQSPNDGRLVAHAWVECEGEIVLGGSDSTASYTTLIAVP
jgi:hypothetical protein